MKKLFILLVGAALFSGAAFGGTISDADQKWLAVVEKMVEQGKTTVSTTSEDRVTLVKNWASTKGFGTEVAKTEQGYQVTFSKTLAQK
jgi:hypothetical protein